MGAQEAKTWLAWWQNIEQILQISGEEAELPAEIEQLAEARVQARLAKDWRKSDELRDELAARGWEARDTKNGQKITPRGRA
jgi:cysteinyl-tRNA synthetase